MNRIVKYLDNMEMTQKIVKIIPGILLGIYTIIHYIQNLLYKIECENKYGIPMDYFDYKSNKNIVIYLYLIMLVVMCVYSYYMNKNIYNDDKYVVINKAVNFLYALATGFLIGIVAVLEFCKIVFNVDIINNVINKMNTITLTIVTYIVLIIIIFCGVLFVLFLSYGKRLCESKILTKIGMISFIVTIIILICGTINEITPKVDNQKDYEFVMIDNEEYIILSKVDNKVIIVPYNINNDGIYEINTYKYRFIEQYDGIYSYKVLKNKPIIKKSE